MNSKRLLGFVLLIIGLLEIIYLALAVYGLIGISSGIETIKGYFFIASLAIFWVGLWLFAWKERGLKFFKRLLIAFSVICIATFIDFITHSTSQTFYVPFEYFVGKIAAATIWGMIVLAVFARVKSIKMKAFLFSLLIALTLQVKYFLQGYSRFFVFLFLFLHFFMFLIPALIIFPRYKEIFG